MSFKKKIFSYVGKTPIVPISFKILGVFSCLLLLSNFTTNFINILLNQHEIISLTNTIMVGQLKDLYTASSNQYDIYGFSHDMDSARTSLEQMAQGGFTKENTMAIAVDVTGKTYISTSASGDTYDIFPDMEAVSKLRQSKDMGVMEGSISFMTERGEFFGVYKYQEKWDYFLIWAELRSEVEASSFRVFGLIAVVIVLLIAIFLWIGLIIFSHMLSPIKKMIQSLFKMQKEQTLSLLDLEGASNDDISYLGASFNSLSSIINNIIMTFQKFVSRDLVDRAYEEGIIHLDGSQKELAIMFSDIRGFTYMTEVMGNDIINLLNIHYDRAIRSIHSHNGIIGSIIGDALLAIYGVSDSRQNKSLASLETAWRIIEETNALREKLIQRRADIELTRTLTETEERVYKAVLLDIGIGLDGGTVFYGNIGSLDHMTNTVIGDNVNAAARLEGLTRVYGLPIIVSEYIKNEVEKETKQYRFIEIDTVQVKGKTEGKKVFTPIDIEKAEAIILEKYDEFEKGLNLYYIGHWKRAEKLFEKTGLDIAKVFLERVHQKSAPKGWNGIWAMETK